MTPGTLLADDRHNHSSQYPTFPRVRGGATAASCADCVASDVPQARIHRARRRSGWDVLHHPGRLGRGYARCFGRSGDDSVDFEVERLLRRDEPLRFLTAVRVDQDAERRESRSDRRESVSRGSRTLAEDRPLFGDCALAASPRREPTHRSNDFAGHSSAVGIAAAQSQSELSAKKPTTASRSRCVSQIKKWRT